MNITTVKKFGSIAYKVGKEIARYINAEAQYYYTLNEPVTISVFGEGAGGINWHNDVFRIESTDADSVTFTVKPFPASAHLWNGPSFVQDYNDGRIEASLIHDLIWTWPAEISKANDISEAELLEWSNLHLGAIWREYAEKKGATPIYTRIKTWLAVNVCNSWLSRLWKRLIVLLLLLAIGGCTGCVGVPDWTVEGPDTIDYDPPSQEINTNG